MSEERRMKIVQISKREVLGMFQGIERNYSYVSFPIIKGLPEGYSVRDVTYNFLTDTFLFKVEHPSFDPVPDGQVLPWWNPLEVQWIECRKIAVEPVPDEPISVD